MYYEGNACVLIKQSALSIHDIKVCMLLYINFINLHVYINCEPMQGRRSFWPCIVLFLIVVHIKIACMICYFARALI